MFYTSDIFCNSIAFIFASVHRCELLRGHPGVLFWKSRHIGSPEGTTHISASALTLFSWSCHTDCTSPQPFYLSETSSSSPYSYWSNLDRVHFLRWLKSLYYIRSKHLVHKYYCWLDNILLPFSNLHILREDRQFFQSDRSDCRRRGDRCCWNSKTLKLMRFFLCRNSLSLPPCAPRRCRCSHRRICSSSSTQLPKIPLHKSWFLIAQSLSNTIWRCLSSTSMLIGTQLGSIELSKNPCRDSQLAFLPKLA